MWRVDWFCSVVLIAISNFTLINLFNVLIQLREVKKEILNWCNLTGANFFLCSNYHFYHIFVISIFIFQMPFLGCVLINNVNIMLIERMSFSTSMETGNMQILYARHSSKDIKCTSVLKLCYSREQTQIV